MKAVYCHLRIWTVRLKDKKTMSYSTYGINGRYYHYGEVPDNYTEDFMCQDTVFEDLIKTLYIFGSNKTLFKKREYINIAQFNSRIYKDELSSFDIQHKYEIVDNPTIDILEKDLGFKEFSELIFDREQELKSILMQK